MATHIRVENDVKEIVQKLKKQLRLDSDSDTVMHCIFMHNKLEVCDLCVELSNIDNKIV